LLAPARSLFAVELGVVFALSRGSQSRTTDGVVTLLGFQIVGQLRRGGERVSVQLGCGAMALLIAA
jgi:hypothetical protein